jgi:hypothetical protein
MILMHQIVPIGGVQKNLDIENNGALSLDPTYPEQLSLLSLIGLSYNCNSIATQFAAKEKLKDLSHIICF